jgi:hypothetical protein
LALVGEIGGIVGAVRNVKNECYGVREWERAGVVA